MKYPVYFVTTAGSDDHMAYGKLHIAAKSRRSIEKHIDLRHYGPILKIERVPGLTSSRLGYISTVL